MIFWIVLLFWYIMSWSDLGRSNSNFLWMSNFFTTLVYFETLSVFTYVSIVVGMKKNPKSSIYNNPAPTFWKTLCDKDWSFYREASILIWSQNSPNSTLIPNFVFFKTYPFLLRFTLRISSSRSLSLWFFAMHIQCKLYIKKRKWTI